MTSSSSPQLSANKRVGLTSLCAVLPALPSVLRYYDEFEDTVRSIPDPGNEHVFNVMQNGERRKIDFSKFDPDCRLIFKHVCAFLITQNLNIGTVYNYLFYATQLTTDDVAAIAMAKPNEIGLVWRQLRGRALQPQAYKAAKSLILLLCAHRFNGWSEDYHTFISTTLPLPAVDKYAAIRSGDVFLSVDEEAFIVRHLDDLTHRLQRTEQVSHERLVDTAMLLCAYQFAMRPIQIAMLDVRHVRIWNDEISEEPTVHLTFHMAKQRGNKKRTPLTRRVKREWVPLFTTLSKHWEAVSADGGARYFDVDSAREAGMRISTLVRDLLGSDDIGTATDLRHTAAQRLVDAGASHEELAEFMGHSQTNTGLVYYAVSASHAERVNRALGVSEVYRRVAKIAHDRFISPDDLALLKDEQQIAAVPHGMPVAGIGGCQSGQPACPYSPVASCYGCRKFMPVTDRALHEKVLGDMREIVLFFEKSSRADARSPTYMQLQRTIAGIQSVISELEDESA